MLDELESLIDFIQTEYIQFNEKQQNNFNCQWELQIWNKEDEMNNINSHEKYKQDYIKWEKENKGGNN